MSYQGLVVGTPAVTQDTGGTVRAYAGSDASLVARWLGARRAARHVLQSAVCKPQVLVTHFALYAFPLRRMTHLPTVVHFHGPWAAESRREGAGRLSTASKRFIEREVYRRADRYVVLSRAFGDLLCNEYAVDPDKVRVIPGGVDLPRFLQAAAVSRHEARATLGWPTDRPVVLSVRRLVSRMGLESLIDSMVQVRRRLPDVLCVIAGRGRLGQALAGRVTSAGLERHVRLAGFIPDELLPLAYRAADVSVVPSESLEGFGLTAAESLAAGTPTLVAPVGGLPEVVTGLDPSLVLPTGAAGLAEGIVNALCNPSSLPSAAACTAHATATFDWQKNVQHIASVYREALS